MSHPNPYHPSRHIKHPRTCSGCQQLASDWWAIDSDDDWQRAYCAGCVAELVAMAEAIALTENLRRRLDSIRAHQCVAEGCQECGL